MRYQGTPRAWAWTVLTAYRQIFSKERSDLGILW
jgi:hypothetical protein